MARRRSRRGETSWTAVVLLLAVAFLWSRYGVVAGVSVTIAALIGLHARNVYRKRYL